MDRYSLSNYDNIVLDVVGTKVKIKERIIGKNNEETFKDVKIRRKNDGRGKKYTYYVISVKNNEGKSIVLYLHKFLARNLIANEKNCKYVSFRDGNTLNCDLDNLVWTDLKDMMKRDHKDKKIEFQATTLRTATKKKKEDVSIKEAVRESAEAFKENSEALTGDIKNDFGKMLFYLPLALFIIIGIAVAVYMNI